jgi:hypothetical protein
MIDQNAAQGTDLVCVELPFVVRQEDVLLAEGTNCGKPRNGFREPSNDWGSGDHVQPFEFTRGVEVVSVMSGSVSVGSH